LQSILDRRSFESAVPMKHAAQRRTSRRLRAWLACALFLVGWIANGWHAAHVEHEVCADHGELVDVRPDAHCDDPAHHDLGTDGPRWLAPHAFDGEHHEHCVFVAVSSNPSARADDARVDVRVPSERFHELAPLRQWSGDGELRFLLAPKQSPPIRETSMA
jgi:hypothetical protein